VRVDLAMVLDRPFTVSSIAWTRSPQRIISPEV
jgi:hypothetical protein